MDERRRVLFSNGGHASSFPLFLFEEEPARKLRSPRRLRSESEQLCSFAVILAPVQAARVHNWVNLDLDRSGGWCRCSRRCVIHARNSSFPSRWGKGKAEVTLPGSKNFFGLLLAMHKFWGPHVIASWHFSYISFLAKKTGYFSQIQVFICSWQGSQVSSDPYLHLNSE